MNTRVLVLLTLAIATLSASGGAAKEPTTQGDVSYVTGGVGTDERAELEAMSGRFNLKVMHAVPNGDFVSDVQMRISNAQGQLVLDVVTNGPLFYAQLPAGTYSVTCSFKGQEQKHSVQVGSGKQTELKLTWPNA